MGEPRRWTLESRHDEHANQHYWRLGDGPEPVGSEDVPVREDRATEAEKAKIVDWLEERYGAPVRDHIGAWGGREEWGADARELLDLVLGGEAFDV